MSRIHLVGNFLVLLVLLTGCQKHPAPIASAESPTASAPIEPKKLTRVTDRPANVEGGVIIVEYHKIAKKEARWDRSIVRFRKDLERFHRLGFRPVALKSYLEGKMDLPPGASPVVFTFDDSHPSQFRLLEDGTLDPDCALGIWRSFAEEHPDFPIRASFYILPPTGPWGQPKWVDRKFAMLQEWGCEVGSHTISHVNFKKAGPGQARKELEEAAAYIREKGFDPFCIALPYGIRPADPKLLGRFHSAALLVGAGPAPAPGTPKLDPLALPRIQGIDGDYGITYWLDRVEDGGFHPYVAP